MLFYKVSLAALDLRQRVCSRTFQAMPASSLVAATIPSDAVERMDDDDNEVIVMDPKNYFMIYLLKTSAFLHSSIAFLMMISYYKLKVSRRELCASL